MSGQELEDVIENVETQNEQNESNDSPDNLRILEAILFASDELLTAARLKAILPGNPDGKQIRKMVDKINVQLQKERHPFEIVEIGGGYQFRTVSFYHTWVRQIFKEKASKKLSVQALECLAIIAYKQPLSKAEIEAIRGVVSDGAMKTLLEKRLVVINGRSEKPGRPLLYATSSEFLKYFGLNKIADLPRIEEFEAIAREKMEDLSIEELKNVEEPGAGAEPEELEEELLETTIIKDVQTDNVASEESNPSDDMAKQSEINDKNGDFIPPPEPTAVFEINLDGDGIDKESIVSKTASEVKAPVEPESEVEQTFEAANDAEVSEKTTEKKSAQEVSDDTDVFDLEIAFDAEDIDDVLPEDMPEKENSGKDVNDVAVSDQKIADSGEKTLPSEDEEMLEIFLPEDSNSDGESRGTEKK